ncbi:hypothetical protein [Streptomyces bluensis]|uniref:Uncharacterized protein n=1 Tax=Streptomyces bluensis TaxID=33897 RepID=A0ABW6UUA4_9ACTN
MDSIRITWRVMAATVCGIISGTLLAMAAGQALLFDTPGLAAGTGLGGLMMAAGGFLIANSSPSRPRAQDRVGQRS